MGATVVQMRAGDAAEVARVFAACFDAPWTVDELAREPTRPGALCLVARGQAGIVGYVLMRAVLDESELLSIGVQPEARGRGVGRALLDVALTECRRAGIEHVHLEVRADNASARSLYLRAGFVEVGRRTAYYPDGTDARLMTWEAT
ncbi:MAG: ribosomal protein S18-alanine N-acetyltransferase [Sandaracinaceae bacterium]